MNRLLLALLVMLSLATSARAAGLIEEPMTLKASFPALLGSGSTDLDALDAAGHYAWRSRRDSAAEAGDQALEACRKLAGEACRIVMLDDQRRP